MVTHAQNFQNSCGPSCLLVAALEMGVMHIPAHPNPGIYYTWVGNPRVLANDLECETILYQVTGQNGALGGNPNDWGYSMPSGIVRCARLLGMQAWVIAHRTWTVRGLKIAYRQELDVLRAMGALVSQDGSWWRTNRSTTAPVMHQFELKVLFGRTRANIGALHYVMVRPNHTVMEPGNGIDYPNINAAKTAVQMNGTGLSVFVQRS